MVALRLPRPEAVLDRVIAALDLACVPRLRIADELEISPGDCQGLIREAEAGELVRDWPALGVVIMHELEAERRGLELYAPSAGPIDPAAWRWHAAGDAPNERAYGVTTDPEAFSRFPDYRGPADEVDPQVVLAAIREHQATLERERRVDRGLDHQDWLDRLAHNQVKIRATIGLGHPCWRPELEDVRPSEKCDVCGGPRRRIVGLTACIACCASSLDRHLPPIKARPRPAATRPRAPEKPESRLRGGLG